VGEAHDGCAGDAGAFQRAQPLGRRHQQRRRLVGPDDARGMRIEGHRHGRAAALDGPALHAFDDLQMSSVQAVEVAEGQDGVRDPRRAGLIR
jgi:hypothetical protein